MVTKELEFFLDGRFDRRIFFAAEKMINAGYAGRNQEEVKKHINELKVLGILAPDKTPTYYPKPVNLVTADDNLAVVNEDGTGEAEYVLLVGAREIFVAVGSDHTDRKLEADSILKAKQIYPNFISRNVWRLTDVEDHWDDLVLRAWNARQKGVPYQEAKLSALLSPRDLLELVRPLVRGDLAGTVIYSGTVATNTEVVFSDYFAAELVDQSRGQTLSCSYAVNLVDWFQNQ